MVLGHPQTGKPIEIGHPLIPLGQAAETAAYLGLLTVSACRQAGHSNEYRS
jgi:hypothetical protein